MRTWIKLYTEILRDPKMGRLTDRQGWACTRLFLLAGTIDDGGRLGTLDELVWHLRADPDELAEDMAVLSQLCIMEERDGEWWAMNFDKRQARPPSAAPDAVNERVKRHRAKEHEECNEDVTMLQRGVTPSEIDPDPEIDSDSEQKEDAVADPESVVVLTLAPTAPHPKAQPAKKSPTGKNGPGNGQEPTEGQALFAALANAYRMDLKLLTANARGRLNAASKRIREAGYTAADIDMAGQFWWMQDWRGKDNKSAPTDGQFFETLSKLRATQTADRCRELGEFE